MTSKDVNILLLNERLDEIQDALVVLYAASFDSENAGVRMLESEMISLVRMIEEEEKRFA